MQQRGNLQRRRVDAGLAGQGHYLVGQAFRSLQMFTQQQRWQCVVLRAGLPQRQGHGQIQAGAPTQALECVGQSDTDLASHAIRRTVGGRDQIGTERRIVLPRLVKLAKIQRYALAYLLQLVPDPGQQRQVEISR